MVCQGEASRSDDLAVTTRRRASVSDCRDRLRELPRGTSGSRPPSRACSYHGIVPHDVLRSYSPYLFWGRPLSSTSRLSVVVWNVVLRPHVSLRADVSTNVTAATVNVVGCESAHWTRALAAHHAFLRTTYQRSTR